jgi:hypothetical protein
VLAAHYRVVANPATGARDWVAFSSNAGLGGTELIFYEASADLPLRWRVSLLPCFRGGVGCLLFRGRRLGRGAGSWVEGGYRAPRR